MPEPFSETLATVAAGRTALGRTPPHHGRTPRGAPARHGRRGAGAPRGAHGSVRAARRAGTRARTRRRTLGAAAPCALLEPPRAARPAFAVVVLPDHRTALPVENHH